MAPNQCGSAVLGVLPKARWLELLNQRAVLFRNLPRRPLLRPERPVRWLRRLRLGRRVQPVFERVLPELGPVLVRKDGRIELLNQLAVLFRNLSRRELLRPERALDWLHCVRLDRRVQPVLERVLPELVPVLFRKDRRFELLNRCAVLFRNLSRRKLRLGRRI